MHTYHVHPVGSRDREEAADHQYATASCAGVGRVHRLRSPVLLCSAETTASRKVQSVLCVERVAAVSTTAHDWWVAVQCGKGAAQLLTRRRTPATAAAFGASFFSGAAIARKGPANPKLVVEEITLVTC